MQVGPDYRPSAASGPGWARLPLDGPAALTVAVAADLPQLRTALAGGRRQSDARRLSMPLVDRDARCHVSLGAGAAARELMRATPISRSLNTLLKGISVSVPDVAASVSVEILLGMLPVDEESLIGFARALARTPSVSGTEGPAVELTAAELLRLGFDDVRIDGAGNCVGVIGSSPNGHRLLIDGHIDSIPLHSEDRWSVDPFGGQISDGRLYGLGICDQKGSIAAAAYGLAVPLRRPEAAPARAGRAGGQRQRGGHRRSRPGPRRRAVFSPPGP